jgi:hypothetical protein
MADRNRTPATTATLTIHDPASCRTLRDQGEADHRDTSAGAPAKSLASISDMLASAPNRTSPQYTPSQLRLRKNRLYGEESGDSSGCICRSVKSVLYTYTCPGGHGVDRETHDLAPLILCLEPAQGAFLAALRMVRLGLL